MHTRIRQTLWVACIISCAACGDDDTTPDASEPDAAVSDAAAETTRELEAKVIDVVASYQEQSQANCPCFVEMGAYPSIDECEMWQGGREEWVSCATNALKDHDSPETREMIQCYADKMRAQTACLATKACDAAERAECSETPLDCLTRPLNLALMLAMSCPDISLLPRQ